MSEPSSDGTHPSDVGAPGVAGAAGAQGADAPVRTASATPLQVALGRLDGIHQRPTHEQADLYQSVHTELQNALGTIDDA